MSYLKNRYFTAALLNVVNSNPNGDPDRNGEPRVNEYSGLGEITDVSYARKVRDIVNDKNCLIMQAAIEKLGIGDDLDRYNIMESKDVLMSNLKSMTVEQILEKYWDIRMFGSTLLVPDEGKKSKGKKKKDDVEETESTEEEVDIKNENGKKITTSGVMRNHMSNSICPVEIRRMTLTQVRPRTDGDSGGMAPNAFCVVNHGLYLMTSSINPNYAHKTHCTSKDIELWLALAPYAYAVNPSFVRQQCEFVKFWVVEHEKAWGSFSENNVKSLLTPRKKDGKNDMPSYSLDDYDIPEGLPANFAGIKSIRELVSEPYL